MNTYRNPNPGAGRRGGNRRRPTSPIDTPFDTTFAGGPEREQRRRQRPDQPFDHEAEREDRRRERPGPGRGHGPRGGRGPGRGGGRGQGRPGGRRRDVRGAVLLVLAEEPMHGYQVMQAIAERTDGRWRPSPGAVYPVLQALEDEGLVTISADSGRKVATLTDAGTEAAAALTSTGPDPFLLATEHDGPDLRSSVHALAEAARTVARNGSPAQQQAAQQILDAARRDLYGILAETPEETP